MRLNCFISVHEICESPYHIIIKSSAVHEIAQKIKSKNNFLLIPSLWYDDEVKLDSYLHEHFVKLDLFDNQSLIDANFHLILEYVRIVWNISDFYRSISIRKINQMCNIFDRQIYNYHYSSFPCFSFISNVIYCN